MRKNRVTAHVQYLFTKEELAEMSAEQIDERIDELFAFDNFKTQYENGVKITDPHRAEGLHRLLYRCPVCQTEGKMLGEGVTLTCQACGKVYTMDEYGRMHAENGETEFPHIPDWTEWERECVRKELEQCSHTEEVVDTGNFGDTTGALGDHGGGDLRLSDDFVNFVQGGETSISCTELADSINGHKIVFAADYAVESGRRVDL